MGHGAAAATLRAARRGAGPWRGAVGWRCALSIATLPESEFIWSSVTEAGERLTLPLRGLLAEPPERVIERLGRPRLERRTGPDRWLLYERDGIRLRIRCGPGASPVARDPDAAGESPDARVASWTASFPGGEAGLRAAAERVGLWPDCAPDASPTGGHGLLRRPLPDGRGGLHSLTATVRGGRVVQLTAFDEPPEWLPVPE